MKILEALTSIKKISIIIFIFMSSSVQAQVKEITSPQTILLIDKNPPAYNTKQKMWIQKNGVNLVGYNWDNPEINLNLKKAIVSRNISRVTLGAAGFYFMRGTLLNMVAAMVDKGREKPNGSNSYLYAGGFALLSGISFCIEKGKFKKASRIRNKQIFDLHRPK